MYPGRPNIAEGGLMSYATDTIETYRGASSYIDRILRGAKPGELPIQVPAMLELVINLKTRKAIGLTIPAAQLRFRAALSHTGKKRMGSPSDRGPFTFRILALAMGEYRTLGSLATAWPLPICLFPRRADREKS